MELASVDGVSSSVILASPPELLKPPSDDIGRMWASKFDLKLLEHQIKLQDASNACGAILEGSYIIVEGTCITKEELNRLSKDIYGDGFDGLTIAFDKSNVADCPCCGPPGLEDEGFSQEDGDSNASDERQSDTRRGVHFDVCLFLLVDAWRNPNGFVDMLLIKWVSRDEKIAERVGFLRTTLWQKDENLESFSKTFCVAAWQRFKIKLV